MYKLCVSTRRFLVRSDSHSYSRNCRSFMGWGEQFNNYLTVTSDNFYFFYSFLYTNCREENSRCSIVVRYEQNPQRKRCLYHREKTSLIMPRLLFSSKKHQQCIERTKNTFSVLFYELMMRVLRRCICWRFHNVRATSGRVAKFQFLKKLSRWSIFFLLQTSSELKILEHNVKNG